MLEVIIFLTVFSFVLLLILKKKDDKNTELAAENGLLKGRMEAAPLNKAASKKPDEPLTVEDIEAAVRCAGYVPETNDDWIKFKVAGELFLVDASRLPLVVVLRPYNVNTNEWDMDVMKQAAHMMADELIMVKAVFDEDPSETSLRFIVAAIDRNYFSFSDNLMTYINLISDGNQRMREIYGELMENKLHPSLPASSLTSDKPKESKILS